MSFLLVAVVALGLLCFQLDPRDYQNVLASEGIHPNPGPGGDVKKAVGTIEERLQRLKREEGREKNEEGAKKQRCSSPPLASCGSTIMHKLSEDKGKEGNDKETVDKRGET